VLNGHPEYRLPNTLNVAFPNRVGADILAQLDGVAASTGSACHSGRVELSPVLKAMGVRPEVGMGAIRFSLGRYTAIEEIDAVVDRLTDVLAAGPRLNAKPAVFLKGRAGVHYDAYNERQRSAADNLGKVIVPCDCRRLPPHIFHRWPRRPERGTAPL
jgi:hypothetical protein